MNTQVCPISTTSFSILLCRKNLKEAWFKFHRLGLVTPITFFIITTVLAEKVSGTKVQDLVLIFGMANHHSRRFNSVKKNLDLKRNSLLSININRIPQNRLLHLFQSRRIYRWKKQIIRKIEILYTFLKMFRWNKISKICQFGIKWWPMTQNFMN